MHPVDDLGQPAAVILVVLLAAWVVGGLVWALIRQAHWRRENTIDAGVAAHRRTMAALDEAERR